MSAVMEVVGVKPTTAGSVVIPRDMREVVNRHLAGLEGFPTVEFVATICEEFASNSQKEKVLKFFLLESPLRARDLGVLLCGIGQNRATQICKEAKALRENRLARRKPFLWEGTPAS